MHKLPYLSFVIVVFGSAALLATQSHSQSGVPKNQVVLQPTTPGTSQSGHLNVSGTARAGQFVGGGAGLTNVTADLLDGLDSTAFLQSVPNPLTLSGSSTTHILRGENSSTAPGSSAVSGISTATNGAVYGVYGKTDSSNGRGVYGLATGFGGSYGGYFLNQGNGVALYAEASTTPIYGKSTATTASGTGVLGESASNAQGSGGVQGAALSLTGETHAVSGYNVSSSGVGVYGIANSGSGSTFGGYFESRSFNGTGVFGSSTPTGSSVGIGGSFIAAGNQGIGAYAVASHASGNNYGILAVSNSTSGVGVKGVAPANGTNIGVWGVSGAANGWGVYSDGRLGASGTKLFRIDHPSDPENMWLQHYCTEGPEPINSYSGNVTTDKQGVAWIQLPDYFDQINRDFRYVLTVVDEGDDFVQAKVWRKIKGNQFAIRTSAPNTEVSWEVKAVRNDLWVQKHGAPVEVEKQGKEKGKYQHPELYGLPKEMGISYDLQADQSKTTNRYLKPSSRTKK